MANYIESRLALFRADLEKQIQFHANRRLSMTDQHPITPPPELVRQWLLEYYGGDLGELSPEELYLAKCGAQWGYEQHEKELLDAMHAVVPQPYEQDQ